MIPARLRLLRRRASDLDRAPGATRPALDEVLPRDRFRPADRESSADRPRLLQRGDDRGCHVRAGDEPAERCAIDEADRKSTARRSGRSRVPDLGEHLGSDGGPVEVAGSEMRFGGGLGAQQLVRDCRGRRWRR